MRVPDRWRHRRHASSGRDGGPPDGVDPRTFLPAESPDWVGTDLDPAWCLLRGDASAFHSIAISQQMIERSCAHIALYARRDDTLGEEARDQLRRIALDVGRLAMPEARGPGVSPYMEPITEADLTPQARRSSRRKALVSVSLTVGASVAAGVAIVLGQVHLAFVIMLARLACVLGPFQPPAFPQDYAEPSGRTRLSLCTVFLATLIGHGCDVLLRGCVAVYFLRTGHPGWAIVCLSFTLVGVGGSFGRTAAATIGVKVERNFLYERSARTGGLTIGLLLAAATGSDVYLLVFACAMGVYGAGEMALSTLRVMREAPTEVGLFVRRPFAGMTETVRHDLTLAPERRPYWGGRVGASGRRDG